MFDRARTAVVITCYNDGEFLDESLGSALDVQIDSVDIADVSILIADDGSTERRTVAVLDRLERRSIRVLKLPHRGLGATRNEGIRCANADWFVPLDADNRLRHDFMRRLLPDALGRQDCAMTYGDAMRFGQCGGKWQMGPTDVEGLWRNNHIDACALIRTASWESVGGYNEHLRGLEDWDLWLKFLENGMDLHYVPGIAFEYRTRQNSLINARLSRFFTNRVTPLSERGIVAVVASKIGTCAGCGATGESLCPCRKRVTNVVAS